MRTKWIFTQVDNQNIKILGVFFCTHGLSSNCSFRKPKLGMLIKAHEKYHINMVSSWTIGDKEGTLMQQLLLELIIRYY